MSTPKQNTLTFFYGKKAAEPLLDAKPSTPTPVVVESKPIATSEDEHIAAFYASLSPNERKAHEIAVKSLGTSYDVRRTHGFARWFSKK